MSNEEDNVDNKLQQLSCMLITANVGTIFEESALLELWFMQLKTYVTNTMPQFLAIHCQEIGGKNYESSMKNLSAFIDKFLNDETLMNEYVRVRIFLDEDFECLEKFTALGSLYLIHKTVYNVKLYNFKTSQFETVIEREVYSGKANEQKAQHVEKIKFPQDLFPECRSSRKGFMRTRWVINGSKPLDMVNIHLFHDASNLVAMEKTPSPYAQSRQRALEYTLKCLEKPLPQNQQEQQSQQNEKQVPLFIFGDFNFRLDTHEVIKRITEGVLPTIKRSTDNEVVEVIYHRKQNASSVGSQSSKASKLVDDSSKGDDGNSNYLESSDGIFMTVGKKIFDCENLDETFRATENTKWLLELDNEMDSFKSQLHEFKISFSPSYPFKEDETGGHSYMKTRCPAWCDRILFNSAAKDLMHYKDDNSDEQQQEQKIDDKFFKNNEDKKTSNIQTVENELYMLMGNTVPMGDHKPVLLYCKLNIEGGGGGGGGGGGQKSVVRVSKSAQQ